LVELPQNGVKVEAYSDGLTLPSNFGNILNKNNLNFEF
jgi:hypothetical protein